MLKSTIFICAAALATQLAAEDYASDGFNAKISRNGVLNEVSYHGKTILSDCQIIGSYDLAPGEAQRDTRMFQARDYDGVADFKREGDTLTATTKSKLGSQELSGIAEYEAVVELSPEKISFSVKITMLKEVKSHGQLFARNFNIPTGLIAGRGIRCVSENGKETLRIFPNEYQRDFPVNGRQVSFSMPGYLLNIDAGRNTKIDYWDARQWNTPLITMTTTQDVPYSSALTTIPAGKTFEWNCTISIEPDNK